MSGHLGKLRHYVYTLAYPDGVVFYVGKGVGRRIKQHEIEARNGTGRNEHKCRVIRKIWAGGGQVLSTKLAFFATHEEAVQFEIALIFLIDGLTNITAGGDGVVGTSHNRGKKRTPEQVEANRRRNIGYKHTEEMRRSVSAATLGHPVSEETRRKISEGRKGKASRSGFTLSSDHKRKISKANAGKRMSDEARRRMSWVKAGRVAGPTSEETRRKISKANAGRVRPEETRRKMSESAKARIHGPVSEETRRKISDSLKRRAAAGKGVLV